MREQQQRGESAEERKGAKRVFAAPERGDGRLLDQQESWRGELSVIERPHERRGVALDDVPRERDFVDPERRAGQVLPETKARAERQERAREPSFGSREEVAGKSETEQPDQGGPAGPFAKGFTSRLVDRRVLRGLRGDAYDTGSRPGRRP